MRYCRPIALACFFVAPLAPAQDKPLPPNEAPQRMTIDILYGDFEGGQRVITRFLLSPFQDEDGVHWRASVGRHWNVDRPDPRHREA